jgi:hypothetical protein
MFTRSSMVQSGGDVISNETAVIADFHGVGTLIAPTLQAGQTMTASRTRINVFRFTGDVLSRLSWLIFHFRFLCRSCQTQTFE